MLVPEEVRKCVAFLGVREWDGNKAAVSYKATVFFVSVPGTVETEFIYTVTAKHVVEELNRRSFYIRVNTRDGGFDIVRGNGTKWWTHPTDGSVDVAVIPWGLSPKQADYSCIPTRMFLSDEITRKESIGIGDDVFITGLFTRFAGSKKNLPIIRMGNVAMMPDELIPTERLGDVEAYLIEGRSIGGLSGSPAFVLQPVIGQRHFYLLGLTIGHWDVSETSGDYYFSGDASEKVNMGISVVVPAKKILEVLNHPELVKIRHEYDEKIRRQNAPTLDG